MAEFPETVHRIPTDEVLPMNDTSTEKPRIRGKLGLATAAKTSSALEKHAQTTVEPISPPTEPSAPPNALPEAAQTPAEKADLALAEAKRRWPVMFDPSNPLPLAIGLRDAIRKELGISNQVARIMVGRWAKRWAYLRALAHPDSQRHNLDGTVTEPVAGEHRKAAADLLANRQKRREKRDG